MTLCRTRRLKVAFGRGLLVLCGRANLPRTVLQSIVDCVNEPVEVYLASLAINLSPDQLIKPLDVVPLIVRCLGLQLSARCRAIETSVGNSPESLILSPHRLAILHLQAAADSCSHHESVGMGILWISPSLPEP